MIEWKNQEESLIQNLKDAGCESDVIEIFTNNHKQNRMSEQLNILSKQRGLLLDYVHDNQKKLDCLDYLIYKIKKEQSI